MKKLATTLGCLVALAATSFSAMAQDDFTKGTNYYLIYLDEATAENIPSTDIALDLRIDETDRFLYVWENTYTSGTAAGPNWNGEVGEYLTFTVGNVGWSGLGFCATRPVDDGYRVDLSGITSDYTFHLAMKSTANNSHILALSGGEGIEAKLCIGATAFVDGSKTYAPVTDFTRDGNWHLVEIPMQKFFDAGLRFPEPFKGNYFFMLSGGTAGQTIDMDAIYIYKKTGGSSVVELNNGNKPQITVNGTQVNTQNVNGLVEIYSLTGTLVKSSDETSFDISDLAKGIYVVKAQGLATKIQVK
ncbi:MAG: T9SS type A sorting domain-containing protein [Marinilabiliaceae bacterium]|nr:T9SS type A sorting domain-containing protein [Marinilabiliaceae bacterium]